MISPDQSLLGRVFDSYQNMMQIAACIRETAKQLSVQQPRVLELSRRETGLGDYLPEALIERYATHEGNQPTITSPVRIPYPDKSFDACIITDVYEHIPAELRPELLREMLRVTHGLVLLGAPQGNEIVTRFDRVVFDFIWGKYAEKFEPLEQHVEFVVDPIEKTLETLKAQGATDVIALPCNYVYRWIHQILIYFDLQYRQPDGAIFEALNRIYNERLSPYDYREPSYRYLIAVATHQKIDTNKLFEKLKAPSEIPALVRETDGVLTAAFQAVDSQAADKFRENSLEIVRLNAIINQLQNDNHWANNEIELLRKPSRTGLKAKLKAFLSS